MSYFDHVKCHHCGAMLNPEALSAAMRCPSCGGELSLADLFGVRDAFSEEEGPELSLDDLLAPGRNNPFADDPAKPRGAPSSTPRAGRRSPAPASSTSLVRATPPTDDDDVGGSPSALELMRRMKKNR